MKEKEKLQQELRETIGKRTELEIKLNKLQFERLRLVKQEEVLWDEIEKLRERE